jgi:mono/diheme cytochrome c family protein
MSRSRSTWLSGLALVALGTALGVTSLTSCSSNPPGGEGGKAAPAAMTGDEKIARGRYLVHAIGCGDCHTPGTFYGAPDSTRAYGGSELGWTGPWGTSYAANITPDSTGIASWSEDDIVNAIMKGVKPDGSPVMPPMPWPDLAQLTPEDGHAIAAYLKTVAPVRHQVPALVPPGKAAPGSIVIPPPSAWDAPKGPPAGAPPGASLGGPKPGRPSAGAVAPGAGH